MENDYAECTKLKLFSPGNKISLEQNGGKKVDFGSFLPQKMLKNADSKKS